MTPREFGKCFVGALKNALCANVDPTARGHLAVHRQSTVFKISEGVPVGPGRNQECVGDQYARGPGMCAEHCDRFSRLHDEGFVVLETTKRFDDRVEGGPASRRSPGATVDHANRRPLTTLYISGC